MSKDCSELRAIIEELITDIEKDNETWCVIRKDNPDFEQVSEENWESKEALLWMHGAKEFLEAKELERWLTVKAPLSQTAKSDANDHYLAWIDHIREEGTYSEFDVNDITKPKDKESLINYVIRLSEIVKENGWGTKKKKRALKSFLHFLREDYCQEDVAFIEHIFPKKMEVCAGRIKRKNRPQVISISHQVTGAIIKELAHQCAFGRKNARHHAGEALALIWLCLSSSRIRWSRSLESVYGLGVDAIVHEKEYPELLAPSFFGPHPVRLGDRVARFLQAISEIPSKKPRKTILQTPLPDLRKPLSTAIQNAKLSPEVGEITFLTFLSYPHYFGKDIR